MCVLCMHDGGTTRLNERTISSERTRERMCVFLCIVGWLAALVGAHFDQKTHIDIHTNKEMGGTYFVCYFSLKAMLSALSTFLHHTHTHIHPALERATTIHFLPQLVWGSKNCMCLSKCSNHLYFFMLEVVARCALCAVRTGRFILFNFPKRCSLLMGLMFRPK